MTVGSRNARKGSMKHKRKKERWVETNDYRKGRRNKANMEKGKK